jgi:hypothetical protein
MSIENITDKKEDEIKLIYQVITHPAGFNIDMFGNYLGIRSHCDGYEVTWQEMMDGMVCEWNKEFSHDEAMDAVIFFVEKRYELQCGVDIESELMKESYYE